MNMNKNKHLILKYLAGELDAISAARFEEELKRNPLLREELNLYKEVDVALADKEIMEFRMQLRDMHKQLAPEIHFTAKPKFKRVSLVAVAASLAVVIGFSAINLFRYNNSQSILDKYYQPYEITSTNRTVDSDADYTLRVALEKYQNREYREAVLLFEKVLENDSEQMGTLLYAGISYFEIEEYTKAGKSFSKVITQDDNLYIEQAKWFLGFCYLKTDDEEKAISQFTEIAKSNSYYSEKAKTILKKLR